jgi:hypothetical protein
MKFTIGTSAYDDLSLADLSFNTFSLLDWQPDFSEHLRPSSSSLLFPQQNNGFIVQLEVLLGELGLGLKEV